MGFSGECYFGSNHVSKIYLSSLNPFVVLFLFSLYLQPVHQHLFPSSSKPAYHSLSFIHYGEETKNKSDNYTKNFCYIVGIILWEVLEAENICQAIAWQAWR